MQPVLGVGYTPSRMQLNATRGMDIQSVIEFCDVIPDDTTAELRISYPQMDYLEVVPVTVTPGSLTFFVDAETVDQIPYGAHAAIWLTVGTNPPYIWRQGHIRWTTGGCC